MERLVLGRAACRFPDAATPEELWRNVWEGRRAFRDLPEERLSLDRYGQDRIGAADSITPIKAGLITDWAFPRARFKIPKGTYGSTDLTHWLALEVTANCIEANGGRDVLPRERTAVLVANTLTGEFSRTQQLRLRLPFLDDLVAEACIAAELSGDVAGAVRTAFAAALRRELAEPTEESLAGGLSNTIAGRIANHFDLCGGAFTVDAACASSLVALADAAALLKTDAADAAIVCAVDLSLDPFELVGFSRNGALAAREMRVFDARSSGFWPGEGAAAVLLVKAGVARRRGIATRAVLRGWGISTDGAGGLTRPSTEGQLSALGRAYAKADADPGDLCFVEAHGTGTPIGDPVEVRALAALRNGGVAPLPIGSIKSNIGHTKAAAGLAGLVKAMQAIEHGSYPPHVGCPDPHPVFEETGRRIVPADRHIHFAEGSAVLAGVSSFGFGGINAHVVLEGSGRLAAPRLPGAKLGHQDAELFLFAADARDDLLSELKPIAACAATMSIAEVADLATQTARRAARGRYRVAIVARDAGELRARAVRAVAALRSSETVEDAPGGVFVAAPTGSPRVGFLFPGQAAPSRPGGGAWRSRFGKGGAAGGAAAPGLADTAVAQPAIVAAELAALEVLGACGVRARVAIGHSLGELPALSWAGVLSPEDLVALVADRGALMSRLGAPGGSMLLVKATLRDCEEAVAGLDLAIACRNAADEQVVSGQRDRINRLRDRLAARGLEVSDLPVSHAFHSPDMAEAARAFASRVARVSLNTPALRVISTVTGRPLGAESRLRDLLVDQLTQPVLFEAALARFAEEVDLAIEVGPGSGLTRLALARGIPCFSLDAFGESLAPLLTALARVFAAGGEVVQAPFADRCHRAVDLGHRPSFLRNPCGGVRVAEPPPLCLDAPATAPVGPVTDATAAVGGNETVLENIRDLVADQCGLPIDQVGPELRFLDDLHLNSLAVGKLVAGICEQLGLVPPALLTEFANASLDELAGYLSDRYRQPAAPKPPAESYPGVDTWIRAFRRGHRPLNSEMPGEPVAWTARTVGRAPVRRSLPATVSGASAGDLLIVGDGAAVDLAPRIWSAVKASSARGVRHLCLLCVGGAPVSAFAATLAVEGVFDSVTVVEAHPQAPDRAVGAALALAGRGFREVRITAAGELEVPCYREAAHEAGGAAPLGASDEVLVTGGAKGIGAECALRLARATGARLLLCGRSAPDEAQVVQTMARARDAGLVAIYRQMHVGDPASVAAALRNSERALSPVTCVVHAAGLNRPARFSDLTGDDLQQTRAAKDIGLRHILDRLDAARLKCVVGFGSIVGHLGLSGETHYALANAIQTAELEASAAAHPEVRVLSLDWSIWQGAGMGERLGALDRLSAAGVEPLSLDMALNTFEALLLRSASRGALVICSRYEPLLARFAPAGRTVPTHRFLDAIRVHYPGIELVADAAIQLGSDPYLAEHRIDGMEVLPAVIGLEAMAAAAEALLPAKDRVVIRNASFARAITLGDHGCSTLRLAALVTGPGRVRCTLRSSEDGFSVDAASAEFHHPTGEDAWPTAPRVEDLGDPVEASDLYGTLFFNEGRFHRLDRFTRLSAFEIAARFQTAEPQPWFGSYQPQALLLGNPGLRDAGLHALQACAPQQRVIPVSVEEIRLVRGGGAPVRCNARQTAAGKDSYIFDIAWYDAVGAVCESWRGAQFRAIKPFDVAGLPVALFVPWLERELCHATGRSDLRKAGSVSTMAIRGLGAEQDQRRRQRQA